MDNFSEKKTEPADISERLLDSILNRHLPELPGDEGTLPPDLFEEREVTLHEHRVQPSPSAR